MLIDTRIIHRHGSLSVLAERHEVMWRDGSTALLHPVQEGNVISTFLRAVSLPEGRAAIVDLRRVAPLLDGDLRLAPARDRIGLVFFHLRQRFGSAQEFIAAASRAAVWHSPFPELRRAA